MNKTQLASLMKMVQLYRSFKHQNYKRRINFNYNQLKAIN